MTDILTIGGWAGSRLAFDPLFDRMEGYHCDYLHALAPIPMENSRLRMAWSLGSLQMLAHADPDVPCTYIFFGGSVSFTRHWPAKVIRQMQKQLLQDPEAVLLEFQKKMFSRDEAEAMAKYCSSHKPDASGIPEWSLEQLSMGLDLLIDLNLEEKIPAFKNSRFLWISGSEDVICPPDFSEILPSSHVFHVIQDVGHLPQFTSVETCAVLIENFLNESN